MQGLSVCTDFVIGKYNRRACCKHRIYQHHSLALYRGHCGILHLNLKLIVFPILAIGCNKGILRTVKDIQHTLVQRKSRSKNGCHNHLICRKLAFCNTQRCLHIPLLIFKLLAYLVSKEFTYPLQISPEP